MNWYDSFPSEAAKKAYRQAEIDNLPELRAERGPVKFPPLDREPMQNYPQRLVQEEAERLQEAMLDEQAEAQIAADTAIADSLVQQGEWPDPADYAGLR